MVRIFRSSVSLILILNSSSKVFRIFSQLLKKFIELYSKEKRNNDKTEINENSELVKEVENEKNEGFLVEKNLKVFKIFSKHQ